VAKQPSLATITARVDKTVYLRGENIHVTLTLQAGSRGAYVSEWSKIDSPDGQDFPAGRVMGNASGFDIYLLTMGGKNALSVGHAGVADRWGPPQPPSERFHKEFIFLKPGELQTWHGRADATPTTSGKYQVVGVYMPSYEQVHDLVQLPEARGLLIADVVRSAPVIITVE
jgi:hypothetical protein